MTTPDIAEARRLADRLDTEDAADTSHVPPTLRAMADELERLRAQVAQSADALRLLLEGTREDCGSIRMPSDAAVRAGFAALAAAAPAQQAEPAAHIAQPYTLAEIKAQIASHDYSAELLLQHAMLLLEQAPSLTVGERDAHAFKNFHRLLCDRFDYMHDEKDWRRDQLSLIEHIAKKNSPAEPLTWTDEAILSLLRANGDGPYSSEDIETTRAFMRRAEEIRSELLSAPPQPAAQGVGAEKAGKN